MDAQINSQPSKNAAGAEKTILHSEKPKTLMHKDPISDTGHSKAYN